jgi:hypothetical protein
LLLLLLLLSVTGVSWLISTNATAKGTTHLCHYMRSSSWHALPPAVIGIAQRHVKHHVKLD